MPAARKPSSSASRLSATIRSRLSWAVAGADDPAGGLGHPDLLGEPLALERDDHGAAGLLGVAVEHRALGLAGPAAVGREVDREGAAQGPLVVVQGGDEQVERVPRVGCVVDGLDVGHPAPLVRRRRGRGARAARSGAGPSRRPSRSRERAGRSGCGCPRAVRGPRRCPRPPSPRACRRARTTLIAATPKPATWVTPSAISWSASRDGASDQVVGRSGADVAWVVSRDMGPRVRSGGRCPSYAEQRVGI